MEATIHAEGVSHAFGDEQVLNDIELTVNQGEIFGLLGPSGAGKTTFVKMIAGIIEPDQGEIYVNDHKVPSLEVLNSIGYMAQSEALYLELTAKENLHFFASLYGMKKTTREQAVKEVLDVVDLRQHQHKPVHQYSGGMKRRLSLAIALIHRPRIIILDEPTVGIDPVLRQDIWHTFEKLKQAGMTILVTTHVMDEAEKCDRLALLRNGTIIANDTPEQLKKNQSALTLEQAFLAYGGVKL